MNSLTFLGKYCPNKPSYSRFFPFPFSQYWPKFCLIHTLLQHPYAVCYQKNSLGWPLSFSAIVVMQALIVLYLFVFVVVLKTNVCRREQIRYKSGKNEHWPARIVHETILKNSVQSNANAVKKYLTFLTRFKLPRSSRVFMHNQRLE